MANGILLRSYICNCLNVLRRNVDFDFDLYFERMKRWNGKYKKNWIYTRKFRWKVMLATSCMSFFDRLANQSIRRISDISGWLKVISANKINLTKWQFQIGRLRWKLFKVLVYIPNFKSCSPVLLNSLTASLRIYFSFQHFLSFCFLFWKR